MDTTEIYNAIQVTDDVLTAGQPSEAQLRSLAAAGYTTVINLATINPRYSLPDEAGLVTALGMAYHHIPVEWEAPTAADFAAFAAVLAGLPAGKTLIHCAANYRVTAFYGLYAQKHLGWGRDQFDALRAKIWAGSDYPIWEQFIQARLAELDQA
ncbi:MAG: protein tyrosine phosphatase family protein [Anaerolineales bacterium]|nr:protein tyrosine phosphatase family protein [Anaerolineales bacterium]MCB0027026.1 protein tyrosine phosphatase family protein [Anaerolineales bacterium]